MTRAVEARIHAVSPLSRTTYITPESFPEGFQAGTGIRFLYAFSMSVHLYTFSSRKEVSFHAT
jgi:hypothetical protein